MSWKDFKAGLDVLGKALLWVVIFGLLARAIINKRAEISKKMAERVPYEFVDNDPRF